MMTITAATSSVWNGSSRSANRAFSGKMSPKPLATAIALSCSLLALEATQADELIVEVVPSSLGVAVPPGSGTLEVDLLNPATNSQSFSLEGFQFELRAPGGSGVTFSDATTATSAAYIFAGNSIADSFFGGDLIVSPPPPPATNDLVAFDSVATPNTFVTLAPGSTLGLGLVSFSVDANALAAFVPLSIITFNGNTEPNGTQLVDPSGNPIPFSTNNGEITIGTPVVPEPSVLGLVVSGLVFGGVFQLRRGAGARQSQRE
ncbi:MAG TPA: hypothetical protein VG826_26650 [Pirellulales bacterium]|nr:hypothetical protein [Pirellulales bacterium]